MAKPTSPEESNRRLMAIEQTKRKGQPNGSITEAAKILGDVNVSQLSRWLLVRGKKVGRECRATKEECLSEFRSFVEKHGRVPKRDEWLKVSEYKTTWRSHWLTYEDFLNDSKVLRDNPRILILDIETAPNLAYVWGTWKQNINPDFISANGYVLCWTAKWFGKDEYIFHRHEKGKPISMLHPIWKLLNEAVAVVHYNGKKFDVPTLNKEFLTHGITPPSPYKQIDLLRTMWDNFLFPSNKLDYVVQTLGIGEKLRHEGPQLWLDCMADKEEAWAKMQAYNKRDVELTEKLYLKLLPWIKGHPNISAILGTEVCPSCGSDHFNRDGEHLAQLLKYERYQCSDCGTWFRGSKTISHKKQERFRIAT